MGVCWYTLHTHPHRELQVVRYLHSNHILTFYPTLKVKPVNPRSSHTRGFFPRYLFVQADLAAVGLNGLQWIPGAVGLVSFGGEPAVVTDAFIHELNRRVARIEQAGGLHLDGLKQGDQVQIVKGPFTGYEAVFDVHLPAEERVQLLLHWLGREVKVKVNANAVEKRRAN
jgi:transcriptional antiterminator RfaH